MKTMWPACRLACYLLVSVALIASPGLAQSPPEGRTAQLSARVSAQAVRIDLKASGPFAYTTFRPSESLLVVDLSGVQSVEPSVARTLDSETVRGYRMLPYRSATGTLGVRLEVLLRGAIEPRFERSGEDRLAIIAEAKAAPVMPRAEEPAREKASVTALAAIVQVAVRSTGRELSVQVQGTKKLAYEATRLSNPDRLVLDFAGANVALDRNAIPSRATPVRGIRVSQFKPDVARVVIDLERMVPYRIHGEGAMITVEFAARAADGVKPENLSRAAWKPKSSKGILAEPKVRAQRMSAEALEIPRIPLPEYLTQQTAALASQGRRSEPAAPVVSQPGAAPVIPSPQAQAAPAQPAQAGTKYTGEPISVNLKDVDLKDFFRLIHEISGLNVVVDPAVKGTLTIVLDEVPWDQALDIVLRNNNLDKQLEGNVLRVATKSTLKMEADSQRDLAKARLEAVDPVTTTRVLSYSKASSLKDTLKKFLSSRGDILADERSNTLIIRDIPTVIPNIDNLIHQLDRKGQQVEIEARVVSASRSFARDIGTQFAFASSTTSGRSLFSGLSSVGTSQLSCGTSATSCPIPLPPVVVSGTTAMPLNVNLLPTISTSGISFSHRSPNFALDYSIAAAESKGVGKLLSKPKVITQNNEKAVVKQGTKIPVQTTINNTISVQFIDAVLKLEVTPQITADGTIFMDVLVENTQIDNGIPRVFGIPALNTQSAETKVLIGDGGTVVIGGIIISQQRTDVSQVPYIGSIPMIGHLFRRTTITNTSQELLFFLTPRILPS